jgi:hypothetical protein
MTIRFISQTKKRALAFAALAMIGGAALAIPTAPAHADWHHRYYGHPYHHFYPRYYGPRPYYYGYPPPIVYGPPVYAPPPVVYVPPVYAAPSLNVVIPIR